jgi:hypothetical protein
MRSVVVAAVVATGLVLTQIGAAQTRDPAPREHHTAGDTARAESSLLRLADLDAGFGVDPRETAEPWIPHCAGYPGDRSEITITGSATSSFRYMSIAIGSRATFFRSGFDADAYWRKTVRRAFARCFARVFKDTRGKGVHAQTISAKQVPLGPTGADAAMAFRVVTQLSDDGVRPFAWYQAIAFVRAGRGIAVVEVASGYHPCPCYRELATRVAERLGNANH